MDRFTVSNIQYATILGAGHGIGLALVNAILAGCPKAHVFASYRDRSRAQDLIDANERYPERLTIDCVDPTQEESLAAFCQGITNKSPQMDLTINCVGVLNDSACRPEKSLHQVSMQSLTHSFAVNAAVTPLLAKELLPLIRRSPLAVFSSVSAKVGSIEDNSLGGWYGYRASKAALNMFLKNIAIECSHRSIRCIALALHPGTTRTSLSEPYLKNSKLKIHSASQTASNMLAVLEGKTLRDSGRFFSWDQTEIPW